MERRGIRGDERLAAADEGRQLQGGSSCRRAWPAWTWRCVMTFPDEIARSLSMPVTTTRTFIRGSGGRTARRSPPCGQFLDGHCSDAAILMPDDQHALSRRSTGRAGALRRTRGPPGASHISRRASNLCSSMPRRFKDTELMRYRRKAIGLSSADPVGQKKAELAVVITITRPRHAQKLSCRCVRRVVLKVNDLVKTVFA
jgi:hypothetical protein